MSLSFQDAPTQVCWIVFFLLQMLPPDLLQNRKSILPMELLQLISPHKKTKDFWCNVHSGNLSEQRQQKWSTNQDPEFQAVEFPEF